MNKLRTFTLGCLFSSIFLTAAASPEAQAIRNFDFKEYYYQGVYADCRNAKSQGAWNDLNLEIVYADVTADGIEEAVIKGSSCMTGTAGPDIFGVFSLVGPNKVTQLVLPEPDTKKMKLFGNRSMTYVPNPPNGMSVEYLDTSGRDKPAVVHYKWENNTFKIVASEMAPTYQTSYDCEKTKDEQEQAICAVKDLADLDLKLAAVFKTAMANRHGIEKKKLRKDQIAWVKERKQKCVIYKWWVDCLKEAYQSRITALSP